MKKLYLFFSVMAIVFNVHAQLFQQNFQSSTSLNAYFSLNPSNGQFNELFDSDPGTNMVVSINGLAGQNTLRFASSGPSTGGYTRNTDFSKQPQVMIFKFDLTLSGDLSTTAATVASWYFGNGFPSGGVAPAISDPGNQTYSYFQLDFLGGGNPGKARFKSSTGAFSANFDVGDTQSVFFIVNNSGVTINYPAPDGSTESVGNDQFDFWVGTEKAFNDLPVSGPTEEITDMKFLYSAEEGILDLDNIVVDELSDFPAPFYQNFSTSTTVADYADAGSPNNGQFNQIFDGGSGANASNMVVSITLENRLQFDKNVTGQNPANAEIGAFLRTTNFAGAPNTLMFEFDFLPTGPVSDNGNSAAKLYFGSNLPGGVGLPGAAAIHSYIELDLDANGADTRFRFRKGGLTGSTEGTTVSPWYLAGSTPYRILFVINNSGAPVEYFTPAGTVETMPNDEYNVWVGTTKSFTTNGNATNVSASLQDVKFIFNNHIGTLEFGNMLINPIPTAIDALQPEIISNTTDPRFTALWTQSTPFTAITGYRLDVATNDFPPGTTDYIPGFENLYVDGPTVLSQLVDGVSPSNTHYIRVRPVYQIGSNEVSGAASTAVLSSAIFLPVKLTSFTANLVNRNGEMKWVTEEEINSSHYEVERSADGQQFERIGTVVSVNSVTGSSYSYTDATLLSYKNYYRLKMVDIDGKYEYSHVVVLNNNGSLRSFSVYPNPSSNGVMVQYDKASPGAMLRLVNMEGRIVKVVPVTTGSTQIQLNLGGLVPGTYNLIYNNNGQQQILKIQKQ